jgi:hypothetical protein
MLCCASSFPSTGSGQASRLVTVSLSNRARLASGAFCEAALNFSENIIFTFAIEKHYKNLAGTPTLFERNGSGVILF